MKVLDTGEASFIGPHLADRLVTAGHDIVAFDNEPTGRRESVLAARRATARRLRSTPARATRSSRRALTARSRATVTVSR
jgi:nucleoside-diphosphate-sugar epimerase